jgi:endo-1,4-beta-xylanase
MAEQWTFPKKDQLKPNFKLPDPLVGPDGKRISSPAEWPAQREYLKAMLEHYLYGHAPKAPVYTRGKVVSSRLLYGGRAVREIVNINCGPDGQILFEAKITRPNTPGKHPVIVWNHPDWPIQAATPGIPDGGAEKRLQDSPSEEEAIARGYAIVIYRKDQLTPMLMGDTTKGISDGQCHKFYPEYDWRAIAIWGWGSSRVADYLATTPWADMEKLAVTGCSHCGKSAIYAAVFDERFAVCIASCSGSAGAGNFRYLGGRMGRGIGYAEAIKNITEKTGLWYWLSDNLAEFGKRDNQYDIGDEAYLPFDTHFLRALVAPRAFISLDGLDDVWCGAFGTQLSWHASQPTYKFLGAEGKNALFFREGRHEYNKEDWNTGLDFCDYIFYGAPPKNFATKVSHVYLPDFLDMEKFKPSINKMDFSPYFDFEYND